MASRPVVFYGYPSDPPSVGETIETALSVLKGHRDVTRNGVRFKRWPTMPVSGKHLAQTIMKNIDRSNIFACDLTYLNDNVSFELGYAIGCFKRVFASVDTSIEDSTRRFKRNYYNFLGFAPYQNYKDLTERVLEERPWDDLHSNLLNVRYRRSISRPEFPTLFYVKPKVMTTSVIDVIEHFKTSIFCESLVIDDPKDNPSPSLDWYAEQLTTADAVIVHLLSTDHTESQLHNNKSSLIAGLTCGLKRQLLILAHAPYESPVDYEHLLRIHETAESCVQSASSWLEEVGKDLPRRRQRRRPAPSRAKWELPNVALGQPVAEHERDDLDNYFVETSPYYRALEGPTTILVGRRGTGKTAILYAIRGNLERNNRNHVTILNPVGYELEGLVRVLQEIHQFSERGFLIESLWKYLIYSEVALSVEESLTGRPIYQTSTSDEIDFLEYCQTNAEMIRPPFSVRLDNAVRSLEDIGLITDAGQQRARISECLHATLLRDLRKHLGSVLRNYERLAILIDNLDEPWSPGAQVAELSELIRGLLNVVQDIPRDLGRSGHGLQPVNAQVTVLLRSDIFAFVQPLVNEQDKLPIERITWSDHKLLLRVLNRRLFQNAPNEFKEEEMAQQFFPEEVVGVSPIDFIFRTTLPRPRDVIYLAKAAINYAIDRQHESVLADDLLAAREQYSEFAFRSVLAEDNPNRQRLEAILYEFAGAKRTATMPEIEQRMLLAGVEYIDYDEYIDLLCDIGFLGISTNNGFRYSRDEGERVMLREVADRLAANAGAIEVFEINPAFYQVLQIE